MLTYSYSQEYSPSMPVIEIGVSAPGHPSAERPVTAVVDTGADGTLLPLDLLEAVGARHVGEARIRGILETSTLADVYLVNIRVGSNQIPGIRAIAIPGAAEVILGRNVLNHMVITLNGPASTTEIPE